MRLNLLPEEAPPALPDVWLPYTKSGIFLPRVYLELGYSLFDFWIVSGGGAGGYGRGSHEPTSPGGGGGGGGGGGCLGKFNSYLAALDSTTKVIVGEGGKIVTPLADAGYGGDSYFAGFWVGGGGGGGWGDEGGELGSTSPGQGGGGGGAGSPFGRGRTGNPGLSSGSIGGPAADTIGSYPFAALPSGAPDPAATRPSGGHGANVASFSTSQVGYDGSSLTDSRWDFLYIGGGGGGGGRGIISGSGAAAAGSIGGAGYESLPGEKPPVQTAGGSTFGNGGSGGGGINLTELTNYPGLEGAGSRRATGSTDAGIPGGGGCGGNGWIDAGPVAGAGPTNGFDGVVLIKVHV